MCQCAQQYAVTVVVQCCWGRRQGIDATAEQKRTTAGHQAQALSFYDTHA